MPTNIQSLPEKNQWILLTQITLLPNYHAKMNKKSIQIVIHLNFMVYKEVNSFEKNHNQFTIRNSNPKLNLLFIQIEATYVDWEKGIGKLKVLFPLLFIQKKDRKKFASKNTS